MHISEVVQSSPKFNYVESLQGEATAMILLEEKAL